LSGIKEENVTTDLYELKSKQVLSYNNVDWKLRMRKEVFSPNETITTPLLINLIFSQILRDISSNISIRMTQNDKNKMKKFLSKFRFFFSFLIFRY
jgi:myosin XV